MSDIALSLPIVLRTRHCCRCGLETSKDVNLLLSSRAANLARDGGRLVLTSNYFDYSETGFVRGYELTFSGGYDAPTKDGVTDKYFFCGACYVGVWNSLRGDIKPESSVEIF